MTDVTLMQTAEPDPAVPQVYWTALMERSIMDQPVQSLLMIAGYNANLGYAFLTSGYQRTDLARNYMARTFLQHSKNPNDVLIMLDCDHYHPMDIVQRLAEHSPEIGVVGALYYRRGEPYDPLFYVRDDKGRMRVVTTPSGLMQGTIIGTGAIAIKRWVFEALEDAGLGYPWFQYDYEKHTEQEGFQSEDVYFGLQCEKIGIHHYCDASITSDHLILTRINRSSFDAFVATHPEYISSEQISINTVKETLTLIAEA